MLLNFTSAWCDMEMWRMQQMCILILIVWHLKLTKIMLKFKYFFIFTHFYVGLYYRVVWFLMCNNVWVWKKFLGSNFAKWNEIKCVNRCIQIWSLWPEVTSVVRLSLFLEFTIISVFFDFYCFVNHVYESNYICIW